MNKKTIIAIVISLIISALGAWFFIYKYPEWRKSRIQTYSFNAEITSVNNNRIGLKIQKLTPDGQFFLTENKTALINKDTVIQRVKQKILPVQKKGEQPRIIYETIPLQITDLQLGMTLAVYSSKNPQNYSELPATRIEVVR